MPTTGPRLCIACCGDLDLPHEYHLHRDADHVEPSLLPRLHAAFRWVGRRLDGSMPQFPSPEEKALADALAQARTQAAAADPSVNRTYGILTRSAVT